MALGSPVGSPSSSMASNYLPSYLMGESNIVVAPRSNTLSPTKGRTLAFGGATSTSPVSPSNDFNRSILQQRSLFGGYQPSPPPPPTPQSNRNYANTSQVNHNVSMSGPPTQGLFDSLRNDKNAVTDGTMGNNASFSQNPARQFNQSVNQSICDSFLNQSDLNTSR